MAFDEIIEVVKADMHRYEHLHDKLISYITRDPDLKRLVHSHKSRFKDLDHLKEKIERKNAENGNELITKDNIKSKITDICGIRILHLYVGQFKAIHNVIMGYVDAGELALFESPKAYTWDPEYKEYFLSLGLEAKLKESFYTSVHYVVKPRTDSDITCEIQVRTLFEEVWGEIDHTFNYPNPSDNNVVQEQLKVLARVVGAGTRLADSVYTLAEKKDGV